MNEDNLTVVMSVYGNDSSLFFREAVDSVLNQTYKAKEFIIVVDGPVGDDINSVLDSISQIETVNIIRLTENKGLAVSRKLAISKCVTEFVAVMDSDDICVPDRFEEQIELLSGGRADVAGGWIEEFSEFPGDQGIIRKTPLTHEDIYSFGKWRNPINHVTLMFRRSAYEAVGGYSEVRYTEDWEMISRMLVQGIIIKCVPKVLVNVRAGNEMVVRRRKLSQIYGEFVVFRLMYKAGYLSLFHLIGNILIRVVLRIFPSQFTSSLYKNILRKGRNKI